MRNTFVVIVAAAVLAAGVALGGWFVGRSFVDARAPTGMYLPACQTA